MQTITLYRPTGPDEWRLVEESGFQRWPPRLPEQPVFYPVCNEGYAREIARDWNVKDSGVGYVTRFEVEAGYLAQYDVKVVGAQRHAEYWIPAEKLQEFNDHLVGEIQLIATYR